MRRAWALVVLLMAAMDGRAAPAADPSGWTDLNRNGRKDVYEDRTQPIDRRVADLLSQMTLDERIGQLVQAHRNADAETVYGPQLRQGEISSFLDGSELIETPGPRNQLQHIAVEQSRLGIPLIFGHDSIHGFRTIFPIPLAESCAWEPGLFERTQTVSARETAAVGIDWTFAPMVDLARDPRWGRISEGYGEDPWLGALDAAMSVRGFQGPDAGSPDRVAACLKHYVGYGAAEGGRDYNTTEISEFTLRNFYLPQYRAGVEAGALTVMSAFNCLSGMPASGNRHTLTDILRGEFKFRGYVVSDWASVAELIPQGVAASPADAARLALNAGVDMEMVSTTYSRTLSQQVKAGLVPESEVTEAARRVLTVKFAKGLFDRPYVDESVYSTAFLRPDAVALAREAAAKSCVLLKNTNHALPLRRQAGSVALLGPFSDATGDLLGCWAARGRASDVITLSAGIKSKLAPGALLTTVRGCNAVEAATTVHRLDGSQVLDAAAAARAGESDIAHAVEAARAADTVILALGEPSSWSGENSSRSSLDIPGRQMELFEAVAALGKPVIVVLINGRPLAVPRLAEKAAAILEVWNPGVQGGMGVADVLFGDTDPGGRLTTSFPRDVGQVPVFYNHYNTGRPDMGKYVDGSRDPLFPFGYGLAYTEFEYGDVDLSGESMARNGSLTARVRIKNTGNRAGVEVAQLYIRQLAGSAGPRPVRELRGFRKVRLEPGETQTVEFSLSGRELGYYDTSGRWLVDPGKFMVWIARDSASGEPVELEVLAGDKNVPHPPEISRQGAKPQSAP